MSGRLPVEPGLRATVGAGEVLDRRRRMWPTKAPPSRPATRRKAFFHPTSSLSQGPKGPEPQEENTMSQNYDRLVSVVQAAREDVEKAEAGNKAATSRVRKAMQEVKNIAQDIRKEMLEVRDAGGAKP